MSDDRLAQARAEAERQIHVYGDDFKARTLRANLNDAFAQGVEWADANPQPRTITRGELRTFKTTWWLADRKGLEGSRVEYALRSIGIEAEDDDE